MSCVSGRIGEGRCCGRWAPGARGNGARYHCAGHGTLIGAYTKDFEPFGTSIFGVASEGVATGEAVAAEGAFVVSGLEMDLLNGG